MLVFGKIVKLYETYNDRRRLVGSPVESVIPIRWEDDKPC